MFWCLELVSFVFTEKFQNLDLSQKYQDFLKVVLNFLILCTVGMLQKQSLGSPGGLGGLVSSGIFRGSPRSRTSEVLAQVQEVHFKL